MLKKVENVKSILENDDSKASLLDSTKKSPLHAAAFNGTPEIAGIFYYNCIWVWSGWINFQKDMTPN